MAVSQNIKKRTFYFQLHKTIVVIEIHDSAAAGHPYHHNTYSILVFTLPLSDVRLLSEQTNEDMQSQCLITSVHIV